MSKYLTLQDIFNGAYIQAQKKTKCMLGNGIGSCLYRNAAGERCFIGALIPDDVYNIKMEGCSGISVLERAKLIPTLDINNKESISDYNAYNTFIEKLQKVHDKLSIKTWDYALLQIAREYNLKIPIISSATELL